MKSRVLTFWVVFCFISVSLMGEVFAASKAGKGEGTLKVKPQADRIRGDEVSSAIRPVVKYSVPSSAAPVVYCTDVWPQMGETPGEYLLDHHQVGTSWYDFQKNGSMGRMISVTDDRYRHIGWMYSPTVYDNPNVDIRYVYWNGLNPAGALFNTTGTPVDGGEREGGGYCNQDHMLDGTGAAVYHRSGAGKPPDGGDITPWSMVSIDDVKFAGLFSRDFDIPDNIIGAVSGEAGSWPKFNIKYDATNAKDYIHVVMTEGNTSGVPVMIAYVRCYLATPTSNTMYCQAPMKAAVAASYTITAGAEYEPKLQVSCIDSSCSITPVVVSSPVSKRIAIAYMPSACDESCDYGTDVAYVESINNCNDWMLSGNYPPKMARIVDYGCKYPTEEMGFADLSACYDYKDSLHIVWSTVGRADNAGSYYPGIGKLWHWCKQWGVSMVTSNITEFTNPGYSNGVICKPSVSSLNPIYHPTEPSATYLYMTWTQFDSGDVSAAEFGNGELYGTASNDGGRTFGNVWNLTQTRTPGCLPGDCVSEHWSTLANNMQNGELHLEYICDKDAGFCIQDGTAWLENKVMYMNLARWAIGERYEGAYTRVDPGSFHTPPLKVTPGGSRTLTLKLTNVGNMLLDYTAEASETYGCITGSYSGVIPITESVTLTFNVSGAGVCSGKFLQGGINLLMHETEVYVPVHAIVANDYYECPVDPVTYDTIETWALRLYANANSLEWMEDKNIADATLQAVFFQGGSFVATKIGADKMVGRWYSADDARSAVRDRLYYSYCQYNNDYDCHVMYTKNIFIFGPLDPPDYLLYNTWWWWEWSKQIKVCELPNNKKIVINYIRVKRHDPPTWWPNIVPYTGHEDTYIGMMMDFDCPYDTLMDSDESARNWGGYDAVKQIAWQHGLWNSIDPEGHPDYADYYCGMALANTGSSAPVTPYGAHVIKNNQYLYPNGGWGWKDEEFYDLAATPGNYVQDIDSALDRSVVMTAAHIPAGNVPNADYSFVVVEVATANGLADMQALVDTARVLVVREKAHGFPIICGDIDGNGSLGVGDVTFLQNYLYQGGPAPCPLGRADVDGNGFITDNDIQIISNYVLNQCGSLICQGIEGPPPLPTCSLSPRNLDAESDTLGVYLNWTNPQSYSEIYVYCQTDNVELIDVIPGYETSYFYTPNQAGTYCYFLKGVGGAASPYSDPACVSFSPNNFLDVPSAITWDDSSMSQFHLLHCYDPGGYIPDSYLPTSYTPGYYDPPVNGVCPSGFFWDPGTELCWQECVEGFFWDQNNQKCREYCSTGYFWDDDDNLCRENCPVVFFWDADDDLCRPKCATGYYWDESLNQCCEVAKDLTTTATSTGWAYGNPTYGPGLSYLGWGTNLQNQWYDNYSCTQPLVGAIVSVPSPQPLGGTRIYVKHWFRTADSNDRLLVVVKDRLAAGDDIILTPTLDGTGFVGYYDGVGNNACGTDMPGFAVGEGKFVWSRFDIPTSLNGKKLSLKFILGSDGSGNMGPGGASTGWFLNKALYIGMELHRGDANCSGAVDLSDAIYLLNDLFKNGPSACLLGTYGTAGDVTCDGLVNLSDVIYLLNYLFKKGTPPPCAP